MQFIDTHAHIYLEEFSDDRAAMIERARGKGVQTIIMPNIDRASWEAMHDTARAYPDTCVPLLGLHPTHVKDNFREELEILFDKFGQYDYPAIGEIGIDLYWDKTYFAQQQEAFEFQLHFAMEKERPVVIHARESFAEILEIIRKDEFSGVKGIFHAFTGDLMIAREVISKGFFLGIGGIVTFKNSHLAEVVREIDLRHLVLETDAPFLSPTPFRGKRNESSYIPLIAEHLAEIKGVSLEEVASVTTENANQIFNLC